MSYNTLAYLYKFYSSMVAITPLYQVEVWMYYSTLAHHYRLKLDAIGLELPRWHRAMKYISNYEQALNLIHRRRV